MKTRMQAVDVRGLRIAMVVALIAAMGWASTPSRPARAAGPGLPRTYDPIRVDSPDPIAGDVFAFGIVNAGDLNSDGEDDILASQGTNILNDGANAKNGEVFVISGENGSTIRSIAAPEPEAGPPTATDRLAGFGFYLGRIGKPSTPQFTDLGSCPGGDGADADRICDLAAVGGPDGVPDILASAIHVNRASDAAQDEVAEDIGRVYVVDGATGAVLKRLDMPQADVDDLADETERLTPASSPAPARPWFGRTVLNPAGLPPCEGNMGVGACPANPDIAVVRGDLDGAGAPDIVVGASAYKYEEADDQPTFGQNHAACDDTPAVDTCIRSGRVYMFRGEQIVGSDPADTLEDAAWNIKNPFAQADVAQSDPESTRIINQLELWGHSIAPVGDVGRCNVSAEPGDKCPPASINGTPDGLPEVLVSAFRVDYPVDGPDNDENPEIGVNAVLDGATGSILQVFKHPNPQAGSIFGFQIMNQPVLGNVGGSPVPDVYVPAGGQDTDTYRGEGIGYIMNPAAIVSGNILNLQRFRDPTPQASGNFGTTAAGVGDLVGDLRNEILIGAFSGHNPPQNTQIVSDVHFFNAADGQALQTIDDPDQQGDSLFGVGLAPLGDLNEDGFLDFAVSAPRHDVTEAGTACATPPCVDIGRIYIFVSENRPATEVSVSEGTLNVIGAPATSSNIEITRVDADTIRVTDRPDAGAGLQGAPVSTGAQCRRTAKFVAECDAASVEFVFVDAGDLDDSVVVAFDIDSAVIGGTGSDLARSRGGFDFLLGGQGHDTLLGGARDDVLFGGRGNDDLKAGSGADFVVGGGGVDDLRGGRDTDELRARDDRADARIRCGRGRDTAFLDAEDPRARGCENVRRSPR